MHVHGVKVYLINNEHAKVVFITVVEARDRTMDRRK